LFSESATPFWSWGLTQNGLIAQWDCGDPKLGWPTGDLSVGGDVLEIGSAFIGVIDYDPTLSESNLRLTTKTYAGQIIDSIVASQLLPAGEDYKIGFSADQDDAEGVSYFKNLKITIG
jgi:hypothetical protein